MGDITRSNTAPNNPNEPNKWLAFPFISQINDFVRTEIEYRENNRISLKTPFIKVTPGYEVVGEPTPILKGIVTYGAGSTSDTTSNLTFAGTHGLYNENVAFRPRAGVTSLKIEYLNVVGAVRKATIDWICHSVEELQFLAKYFMHPGMTVFIEMGWSTIPPGIIKTSDTYTGFTLDNHFLQVQENVKNSHGNYDAMIGFITNYTVELNPNGSYLCSTKIASMADIMEGLIIGQNRDKKFDAMTGDEAEIHATPEQLKNIIKNVLNSIIDKYYKDINKVGLLNGTIKPDVFVLDAAIPGAWDIKQKQENYKERSSNINGTSGTSGTSGIAIYENKKCPRYYSWGFIEDEILNVYMAMYADPKNSYINAGTSFGTLFPDQVAQLPTGKAAFCVDSSNSKIGYHSQLRTTDLGIFIFPAINGGELNFDNYYTIDDSLFKYAKADEIANLNKLKADGFISAEQYQDMLHVTLVNLAQHYLNISVPDSKRVIWVTKLANSGITIDPSTKKTYISPRYLLISEDVLRNAIDTAVNPLEFIASMLGQINNACGNYWDLRLQPTSGTGITNIEGGFPMSKYAVVDLKFAGGMSGMDASPDFKKNVYTFRVKPFKRDPNTNTVLDPKTSIIKEAKFSSNLGNATALNVFYNSHLTATGTGSYYINGTDALYTGLYKTDPGKARDRFFNKPIGFKELPARPPDPPDYKPTAEVLEGDQFGYHSSLKLFLPLSAYGYKPTIQCSDRIITKTIETMDEARETLRAILLSKGNPKDNPSSKDVLTPLKLELDLEGISGIRPGDMFNLDYMPTTYKTHGVFQVVGLSHTIDRGYWSTHIASSYRMLNVDTDGEVLPSAKLTFAFPITQTDLPGYTAVPDDTAVHSSTGR